MIALGFGLLVVAWFCCGVLGCWALSRIDKEDITLGLLIFLSLGGPITIGVAVLAGLFWLTDKLPYVVFRGKE